MTYIRFNLFFLGALVLYFGLLQSSAFASIPTHVINKNVVMLEQFEVGYFVDQTEEMPLDQVQQQTFQLSPNSLSLGSNAQIAWIKIKLENVNKTPINLYLHLPYAYHNHAVELYEIIDNKLTEQRILNLDDKTSLQWMYRGSAVFDITLQPNELKTLLVKSVSFSHQWLSINLYDEDQSKRALLGQHTDIALVVGMLLALIIYNLVLFFISHLKEHLFYACYLFSGAIWIAFSYGLIADIFNVYGSSTLRWHLSLIAMPIFLVLFMINILETNKKYPIEHWALVFIITLLIGNFIYGVFDIVHALKLSNILAAIMMAVSLSVAVSMLVRKQRVAIPFLLGHGLFVIFSILALLFYIGDAEFNYINSHGVGIGVLLEALVLSLIIAYRIRSLEKMKAMQADLRLLAYTDPLTQLFNRRHFNVASALVLKQGEQTKKPISIAIFDIDNFKKINDNYGHSIGDQSIKRVADVISSRAREYDILARYGGEEFIILMPNTLVSDAYKLTEGIRRELARMTIKITPDKSVSMTISAGIAEVDLNTLDLQEAINKADKGLYQSKNNGKNQSQLFSELPLNVSQDDNKQPILDKSVF